MDALIGFGKVDDKYLTQRTYNITGMSFAPEDVAASIQKVMPEFVIKYAPDFRQAIAETWPRSINDDIRKKRLGVEPKIRPRRNDEGYVRGAPIRSWGIVTVGFTPHKPGTGKGKGKGKGKGAFDRAF